MILNSEEERSNKTMTEPIIDPDKHKRGEDQPPIAATGKIFDVHEWSGSSPGYLHVHYADVTMKPGTCWREHLSFGWAIKK